MAFLNAHEVQELLDRADQVINPEDIFPVDGGVVLRRHVGSIESDDSQPRQPFIQWFHQHIIRTLLENTSQQLEKLSTTRRVHVLAGRAGQGKSTLMRHAFLHVKRQWDEENPRIQPNFGFDNEGNNLDDSFAEFYRRFVDRTHYIQARNVGPKNELRLISRGSHLILFDGIDEANEENLATIHEFIEKHPQCVFLLSSRTRRQPSRLHQDHEEIINLNRFRALCDENALRKHAAMLHPMGEREKKDMMRIMEEHEPEREFSFLKTLVENNSRTLQVPADFLLYRAKSPNTKSEYYLHHLRWLIDREDSKDVEERQRLVSQFHIPLQSELSLDRLSEGRIYVRMGNEIDIEPYEIFNLIESESVGKSTQYFLDLDTSSTRALLLLSIGSISAEAFLGFHQPTNFEVSDIGKNSVKSLLETEFGQKFTQFVIQEILDHGHKSNSYNCLTSILNGYEIEVNRSKILAPLQILDTIDHNQFNQAINYVHWLIDVIHPIDELLTGFTSERFHSIVSFCLEYLIDAEESHLYVATEWLEFRMPKWYRLILRLAQFGPGRYSETNFTEVLRHGLGKNEFFNRFLSLIFHVQSHYVRETRDSAAGSFNKFFSDFDTIIPLENNMKSKQRVFTTCCFLLAFKSPPPASKLRSKQAINGLVYNTILKPLLKNSTYPMNWPVENFINTDNPDLILSQLKIMGDESHDRSKIIDYYLDIGLNHRLNYLDSSEQHQRDFLLKSLKFLNLVQDLRFDSKLSSIINAYGLMARMGHVAPRQRDVDYLQTTLSADIWMLLFESESEKIYVNFNKLMPDLISFYPSKPSPPPVFHECLQAKDGKEFRRFNSNLAKIKELYKRRNCVVWPLDYSSGKSLRLSVNNKKHRETATKIWGDFSSPEFIENYCAFSSIIKSDSSFGKTLIEHVQTGIEFWLIRGQYLLALILSLRTNRVDVVSILLHAILDHEDGFHQPQNRLVGNYLHRWVYGDLKDHKYIQSKMLKRYSQSTQGKSTNLERIFPGTGKSTKALTLFVDKSIPFDLPKGSKISFIGPNIMKRGKSRFREARIFLENPPRHYLQTKPYDGIVYYVEGLDDTGRWRPFMSWNEYHQKYTEYKIPYIEFRGIMKVLFPSLQNLPIHFPTPPLVGDKLAEGFDNDKVLRSWHTMPFFYTLAPPSELEQFSLRLLKDVDIQLRWKIIEHFTQDEHLATGMSFRKHESPFYELKTHRSVYKKVMGEHSELRTGGFYNIIVDSTTRNKKKPTVGTLGAKRTEIGNYIEKNATPTSHPNSDIHPDYLKNSYTLDLRTHPTGLRTIIHRWKFIFRKDETIVKAENSVIASSFLGTLKYAHRIPGFSAQTQHFMPMWLRLKNPTSGHSNPVYGYKFAFNEAITESNSDCAVEGLCEFSLRTFSSSKPRTVITTIVESDDSEWKTDNRYAHPSWKPRMLESQSIPELLQNEMNISEDSIGKSRTKRAFGIVVEHGRIDEYKSKCIDEAMDKVEENLEQLRKKERVIAGRENLVNAIREFSVTYLHCDWLPGYLEAFTEQKNRMESIMQAIETEELSQMGQSLEGTVLDFTTIRAMLDGLEYKANKLHSEIEETFDSTLEMLNSVTFDTQEERERQFLSLKKTIRRLCLYLNSSEKFSSLRDAMIKAFPNMTQHEISRHCRPRRRMKVRVLGMPQDKFPYAILTSWDEVVGSLWQDPSSCQVGTLVRLDIKPLRRAGNSKVIVTNIAAAVDELDEQGQLREVYTAEWPETLQHTDTLPLSTKDEDIMRLGTKNRFTVPLYIKRTRTYACHPELNIDLPIFDSETIPGEFAGQLRTCTVDVRRDRRRGLFRYYVVDVA